MCMTFIYINPDPEGQYRLIILNNRDEMIDRPTGKLQWCEGVLAGIDEKDPVKGTWMGVDKKGRVGVLLSITQPAHTKNATSPSRGGIPTRFLRSTGTIEEYCDQLISEAPAYNGFQFLAMQKNANNIYDLHSVTNLFVDKIERIRWPTGVHVFGNSPPHVPYQKVVYGKKRMEDFITTVTDKTSCEDVIAGLLNIATDRTSHAPDPQIALQTGKPEDEHLPLCSIFVRFPAHFRYGTRSHSIFIVKKDGNAVFFEQRMANAPENLEEAKWTSTINTFKIKD